MTNIELAAPASQWQTIKLKQNEAAVWMVENSEVYVQRVYGDWMLAKSIGETVHNEKEAKKIDSVPLGLDWTRWTFERAASEVRFWPSLPDRNLVVKTRIPVIVPPKTSVELFVNLPIWLEVAVAQGEEYFSLAKIAPSELSQTWYGTQFEGELCYAVKSRARRSLEDLPAEPLRAACLFRVRNSSDQPLPVERMRIQTSRLSLFQAKDRIWTNSVVVTFKGEKEDSEVQYDGNVRVAGGKLKLLREAEHTSKRGSIFDKLLFNTSHFD